MSITINSSDQNITQYNVQTGAAGNLLNNVAPSATSGVPLISQGSSAQPLFGTAVVAGGGTGNTTFTAYSVITAGATATGSFQNVVGVGSTGNILTSNGAGALPTWQASSGGTAAALALTQWTFYDDFEYDTAQISTNGSSFGKWGAGLNGTSANIQFNTIVNGTTSPPSVGFAALSTGTTSTGNASICLFSNGGGDITSSKGTLTMQFSIILQFLSTSSDRFTIQVGLAIGTNVGESGDGIYFQYSDNVNSGNYTVTCKSGGTSTTNNTSIAPSATVYQTLKIILNSAGTSVSFYINGTQVAGSPISTNIPSVQLIPVIQITKSVGTTSRAIGVDFVTGTFVFNTPRTG